MSRKVLVILIVFGLLVGNLIYAPVARGDVAFSGAAYGGKMLSYGIGFVANAVGTTWSGDSMDYAPSGGGPYAYTPMNSYTVTIDGLDPSEFGVAGAVDMMYNNSPLEWGVNARVRIAGTLTGGHTIAWNGHGTWSGVYVSYVGSVSAYDMTVWGDPLEGGGPAGYGVYGYGNGMEAPALSVTIDSGPTAIDLVDGGTWHATATGGTPGYTYHWAYQLLAMGGYFTDWPNTGQSFTHIFPAGTWIIQVQATDSVGAHAYADITVTAATIAGSYQAHLTRSGSYGQYMSVYVTDAAGDFVTISSTASTQFGIYATSGGAFGWVAADNEAVQFSGYTWRWTMSADFGGATGPPPPDFWFQSSIHLAIPNLNLLVMHHFTGISETAAPWFPPGASGTTVTQVVPETPPVPTSTVPDWLVPLRNFFIEIFQYLFVPSSSAFSSQLASGWLLIDSPVPSITPQYTIPFPNPSHLLAPTGDSVNIDFSGIQAYSGYSTYKTIVQVFLDAILVFIVISLVT